MARTPLLRSLQRLHGSTRLRVGLGSHRPSCESGKLKRASAPFREASS